MHKVFLCGLSLLAISILSHPSFASANTLPSPSVIRLSDSHVLFATTFKIGYLNRSATLPLAVTTGTSLKALNYQFINAAGQIIPTVSQAVILPKETLTIANKAFVLPYGASKIFTLYVIAAIPKTAPTRALIVTAIPHTMTDKTSTALAVTKLPSTLPALTTPFSK